LSLGPSSNVRATAWLSRGPRQRDGPKTCDDLPRTAHAMAAQDADAVTAMARRDMKIYCSPQSPARFLGDGLQAARSFRDRYELTMPTAPYGRGSVADSEPRP